MLNRNSAAVPKNEIMQYDLNKNDKNPERQISWFDIAINAIALSCLAGTLMR